MHCLRVTIETAVFRVRQIKDKGILFQKLVENSQVGQNSPNSSYLGSPGCMLRIATNLAIFELVNDFVIKNY